MSEEQQEAEQLAHLASVERGQRAIINSHAEPPEQEELTMLTSLPGSSVHCCVDHPLHACLLHRRGRTAQEERRQLPVLGAAD
jgi:hypothetical protein